MDSKNTSYTLREIKLEVTHRCPLVCLHCSSEATPGCGREMPFKTAKELLSQIVDLGVKEIVFSGGEPLIWEGIDDAISMCTSVGIRTVVYTSGNVENYPEAFKNLKDKGVAWVAFSVFGGSSDNHEKVTRRSGSFLKTLLAADEAYKNDLSFEFHFVPLSFNYKELPAVVDLALQRNAKRVSVLRFVPQGRGAITGNFGLTKKQNIELKRMIERNKEKFDVRTGSPYNFLLVNVDPKCLAAVDRLIVGPEFKIYPCDAFKQIEAVDLVGTDDYSRLDKYSLIDCWEKSPYLEEVRNYLSTPFKPPCSYCVLLSSCLSGCLAQKVITHVGLKKAPDPMCLISD